MRFLIDTLGGLGMLFLIGWRSRFRMGNAWWSWRRETVFGALRENWPEAGERRRSIIDYGRWVWRMRRFTR